MLCCFAQHRHHVGSDLVGGVTVRGDAICAYHDAIDFALLHNVTGHVVGDHGNGILSWANSQAVRRALQKRPRLVRDHGDAFAGIDGPRITPSAVP